MAIVIPFIATALGASATTATLISVAFAVTGINKAIDTAAAKVFGEDLVKVANIAGAAFAVYNGGFDIGIGGGSGSAAGAVTDTAKSAVDYTNSMDKASDAYSATNTNVVDKITAGVMPTAEPVGSLPATATAPAQAPDLPFTAPKVEPAVKVAEAPALARTMTQPAPITAPPVQPVATAAPLTGATAASAPAASAPNASFMQKLQNMATSPQVLAGVVQGAAGAYQGSAARAEARDARDAETAKRDALAKVGNAGWKQTFRTPA